MEMSGDYVIAFLRVMPEANEPEKFKANMAAIQKVKLQTLSEFQGKPSRPADQPKGHMDIDTMVLQTVVGPVGQPPSQAMHPGIATTDGQPMNAQYNYVIRITEEEMPPFTGFWSATLYDTKPGYFIPNKENKYSVGQNAGMKLDASGGIEIHIAAKQSEGVPAENWLPINRDDLGIDVIMRVYARDLEQIKTWKAPKAERLK